MRINQCTEGFRLQMPEIIAEMDNFFQKRTRTYCSQLGWSHWSLGMLQCSGFRLRKAWFWPRKGAVPPMEWRDSNGEVFFGSCAMWCSLSLSRRDSHVGAEITSSQESSRGVEFWGQYPSWLRSSKCIYSRRSAAKPTSTRDTTQANKNALTRELQTAFPARLFGVCSKKVFPTWLPNKTLVFTYGFSVSNTTVERNTPC